MSCVIERARRRFERLATALTLGAIAAAPVSCGGSREGDQDGGAGEGWSGQTESSGGGGEPAGGTSAGGVGSTAGGEAAAAAGGAASGGGGGVPASGAAMAGGTGGTGAAGSGAATAGGFAGDGGSPSAGATGSGATSAGGTSTGGGAAGNGGGGAGSGGAGGAFTHPPCGEVPPVDGEDCGTVDYACIFEDCPGGGTTRAGCLDGVWHVRTTPCCPVAPPTTGEPCGEDYYRCLYDDCPAAALTYAQCVSGEWVVRARPCCPAEIPTDAESCGWDPPLDAGTAAEYACVYQDCATSTFAAADCVLDRLTGDVRESPCEPFPCNMGAAGSPQCSSGQLCLEYYWPNQPYSMGRIYECVNNPCSPGPLSTSCLRETPCRGTVVDVRIPVLQGPYVQCEL